MKDFPSCFAENGVQVADASCTSAAAVTVSKVKASRNLVTCIYKCKLLRKSRLIIITWSKNLVGHCFSVEIEDLSHQCLCRVDVKPSFFSKRKGSKFLELNSVKIDVYWDLTVAKFGSSPEPHEGFYMGLVCKKEIVLLIGDLRKEIIKKVNATPILTNALHISKKEHIFGKKVYATKAQFSDNGQIHDLRIECDTVGVDDPTVVIHLDSKIVMQVKHLLWKFRGNYTISIDGLPVELYWDVHNWLFGSNLGSAVFMFQTCFEVEKMSKSQSQSQMISDYSVMPWTFSENFGESKFPNCGFCLTLYVWKNE